MTGPRPALLLRVLLLAGLVWLVVAGPPRAADAPAPLSLTGGADDLDALGEALLAERPPPAVFRAPGPPPAHLELEALAELAERSPVYVRASEEPPAFRLEAPEAPLQGRFAAVCFVAAVPAGDTAVARLLGPGGATLDSAAVVGDGDGRAAGAFRVRPGGAGWAEWEIALGDERARTGAWVAAADPPRVLLVAGPPSWESRYLLRALEGSGARAGVVQRLGRDNVITGGGAVRRWWTPESLESYDAVVLLPGAEPTLSALEAVRTRVAAGGGALLVGGSGRPEALGFPAGGEGPGAVRADSLAWSAPPEIAPLPPVPLTLAAAPFEPPGVGVTIAARASGEPVLLLRLFGRGRAAALGLLETWRWTMEVPRSAEHQAFWRSLIDWLAAPAADSLGLRLEPPESGAGATVRATLGGRDPDGPLLLRRPAAGDEPLLQPGGPPTAAFVVADTGVHEIRVADAVLAAVRARRAEDAPPAELGIARAALLASASGGASLEGEAFRRGLAAAARSPGRGAAGAAVALFVLLAVIACAEWALRRLRGLP